MKIAVELPWTAQAHMGTGVYSETMLRALADAAPEADIHAIVPADAPTLVLPANVHCQSLPMRGKKDSFYRHVTIPAFLEELQPDCLFAPATLLPALKLCPMVAVVHDLTFLTHPEHYSEGLLAYLDREFVPTLRNADHLVAIAVQTKADLQAHFSIPVDRITVIKQPVRAIFQRRLVPAQAQAVLAAKGLREPFFFHVSNLAPHKNLLFAVDVFAAFLKANPTAPHRFVFAGGGVAPNAPPDPIAHASTLGIEDRVHYLGRLSDEELVAVVQGCEAVLFPSLAEGWGLPVAEANALGVPVLSTSHVPAAESHQQLPLDVAAWVEALQTPQKWVAKTAPVDPLAAGKMLYDLLAQVRLREPMEIRPAKVHRNPLPPSTAPAVVSASVAKSQIVARSPSASNPTIAYRADWHSPSGFGEAARRMALALDASGVDWAPVGVPKDAIQHALLFAQPVHQKVDSAQVWIHHLPPDFYDLTQPGRHIGLFAWETDRISSRDIPGGRAWIEALNRLDEIWVPCQALVKVLAASGVRTPAYWMPHPIDTAFYSPGPRRPPCALPPGLDPTWTVFLYVGTWDIRKRPDVLVRAFSRAFSTKDRAMLMLKTYITGDTEKDRQIAARWLGEHAHGDAHIRILPEIFSAEKMRDLYRFATVYATASRGEGFCLPAVEAMSCGKPAISTGWSAFADYPGIHVPFRLEPLPTEPTFPGYTNDQNWAVIDEDRLIETLRWAHRSRPDLQAKGAESQRWVHQHCSIAEVAGRIQERLTNRGK